ncbi:hypothetical protein HCX49_12835 [Sphingobacterium kitahiroshimense]|uniref:hypothetical protein n=1 Tax=Sphingobacterium sp. B16(2022) TaxID=2914044 RepID=UPI00143ADBFC|nr:hypothetical protein [Sphingobacterium sp. B16(2022)]NJI74088.1 hypothetical protein [Sphingobacterium sp. B16(2022)]
MNKLELKSIGVQELDTNEMVNLDGGFVGVIAAFVVGAWLADSLFNYNETVDNFNDGYNSVR